jgi:hypothetical protein
MKKEEKKRRKRKKSFLFMSPGNELGEFSSKHVSKTAQEMIQLLILNILFLKI